MDIRGYETKTNERGLDYEFYSEGPKGKIKKIVRFTLRSANGITYFNLAFGDSNNIDDQFDDSVKSNNHDKDKILATIGHIVIQFTALYSDIYVYAQGSTPSRTRLYQMGINANWDKIEPILSIYGYLNNEWHPFQKKVNYEAFMALRK
jgi:hypothetical protein